MLDPPDYIWIVALALVAFFVPLLLVRGVYWVAEGYKQTVQGWY